MAAEGKGQTRDEENNAFISATSAEDEFDGPTKMYHHEAPPWYSDVNTVLMFVYLTIVVVGGGGILIAMVVTKNPWEILGIIFGFVVVALIGIYLKAQAGKYA